MVSDGKNIPPEKGRAMVGMQRRPGPETPQWKIPRSEWPTVLWLVGQGET